MFWQLKIHQNAFAAAALPRTSLGRLRCSPRPSSRLGREYPLINPLPIPYSRTPSAFLDGAFGTLSRY